MIKLKISLTIISSILYIYNLSAQNCNSQTYTGEGTYYGYNGGGNCSLPYSNQYTGALNHTQYNNAALCGACAEVTGANGKITIRIEDQCPECKFGDIDLNENVFALIDDKIKGRVPISWKIVPCPIQGNIILYFKEGSTKYWTGIQTRNTLFPIIKLEIKIQNSYQNITKENYNYFIKSDGFGDAPYTFKATDSRGESIVIENITLVLQKEIGSVIFSGD